MDYRIFIVRADVNACDSTRGCTDTERKSAVKVDSRKKIPCRTRYILSPRSGQVSPSTDRVVAGPEGRFSRNPPPVIYTLVIHLFCLTTQVFRVLL